MGCFFGLFTINWTHCYFSQFFFVSITTDYKLRKTTDIDIFIHKALIYACRIETT